MHNREELIGLLIKAQEGDRIAEDQFIRSIDDQFRRKRCYKYYNRNRLVENNDITQEFLLGCAIAVHKAKLDVGDPIKFILQSGEWAVKSYMKKFITQGTMQVCDDCGKKSRLNKTKGTKDSYTCKTCGSTNITTVEVNDKDETKFEMQGFTVDYDDSIMTIELAQQFKSTLTEGTNVYNLYVLMVEEGVNPTNPEVQNYIKDIAKAWGNCSQTNVNQVLRKLRQRMTDFLNNQKKIEVEIDNVQVTVPPVATYIDRIVGEFSGKAM